jgi:hypothetical protein
MQKRSRFLFGSGEDTKIESPQTAGVAPLMPGSGVFHWMPLVSFHVSGRFFSGEEPLKAGPRHCGQFSARAKSAVQAKAATARS